MFGKLQKSKSRKKISGECRFCGACRRSRRTLAGCPAFKPEENKISPLDVSGLPP